MVLLAAVTVATAGFLIRAMRWGILLRPLREDVPLRSRFAATCIGFVLAVTHPQAGNIGGGGFMIVRTADDTRAALDFRERAPRAASRAWHRRAGGRATCRGGRPGIRGRGS